MTLGPKPERTKPIAELSPDEYRRWSEDLRTWLIDRDNENAAATTDKTESRRVDHKGTPYPHNPPRKRGARPAWNGMSKEYMRKKQKESRDRKRAERAALIVVGLHERKRKGAGA